MKYDGDSELLKAGRRRLRDAQELLERPTRDPHGSDADHRHLRGAYYLAGYAVECVLKVYIIRLLDSRTKERVTRWSLAIEYLANSQMKLELAGKRSHSLPLLLTAAELEPDMSGDRATERSWRTCQGWDYNARYDGPGPDRASTERFVVACEATHNWIRARLPFGP